MSELMQAVSRAWDQMVEKLHPTRTWARLSQSQREELIEFSRCLLGPLLGSLAKRVDTILEIDVAPRDGVLYWRGSVSDLVTDLASMIPREELDELRELLGDDSTWRRLSEKPKGGDGG